MILPILRADYQIRASATADQPVFVDWELLLVSGVGQVPALSTTLLAPLEFPSPSGPSAPAVIVTRVPITPPMTAPPGLPPSSARSSSMIALGGPLGRPVVDLPIATVGPVTPGGSLSIAYNGADLPAGVSPPTIPPRFLGRDPASDGPSTMPRDARDLARLDEAVMARESWWERLAQAMGPPPTGESPAALDLDAPAALGTPIEEVRPVEMAGAGSGMAFGLIVAVAIARRPSIRGRWVRPFQPVNLWSVVEPDRARRF